MLAACMPHCPAVKEEGEAVRDNTDMLPALEGEEVYECLFKGLDMYEPEPFQGLHM
jgi:hypothetical protein